MFDEALKYHYLFNRYVMNQVNKHCVLCKLLVQLLLQPRALNISERLRIVLVLIRPGRDQICGWRDDIIYLELVPIDD